MPSPQLIIATFFGSGLLKPASGTWGTLAGLPVGLAILHFFGAPALVLSALVAFALGLWACRAVAPKGEDPSEIVIDEVYAFWLVLAMTPSTPFFVVLAFVAFRFFDIVKFPPAHIIDRWHNAWGIMLDDLVAALWAIGVIQIIMIIG